MTDKDTIRLAFQALNEPAGPINSKAYLDQYCAAVVACKAALVEQPVIAPVTQVLKDSDIVTMYAECPTSDAEMIEFARAIEAAFIAKQGGAATTRLQSASLFCR